MLKSVILHGYLSNKEDFPGLVSSKPKELTKVSDVSSQTSDLPTVAACF